jgi:hypothetical protein
MRLLAPILTLLLALPAAGEKIDLTGYLTVFPVLGDFKVYAVDNGDERREEIVDVEGTATRWAELIEQRLNGAVIGGGAGLVVAGRKSAILTVSTQGLDLLFAKPGLKFPLRMALGRTKRIAAQGRAELNGNRIGGVRWNVERLFVGFEAKDTPLQSYPDTARIQTSGTLRVKNRATRQVVEMQVTTTSWSAPGLGLVASEERSLTYVNGALTEDTGPLVIHLVSGQIGGIAFP